MSVFTTFTHYVWWAIGAVVTLCGFIALIVFKPLAARRARRAKKYGSADVLGRVRVTAESALDVLENVVKNLRLFIEGNPGIRSPDINIRRANENSTMQRVLIVTRGVNVDGALADLRSVGRELEQYTARKNTAPVCAGLVTTFEFVVNLINSRKPLEAVTECNAWKLEADGLRETLKDWVVPKK